MRNWFDKIKDPSVDPYERRYRLIALVSIMCLVAWLSISTAVSFNMVRAIFFGAMIVLCMSGYVFALVSGRIQLVARISAAFLVFGMLPMAFVFNGGIYAGAPNWCIIGMVFIVSTISGRARFVFLAIDFAVTVFFFVLNRINPGVFVTYDEKTGFLNTLSSLIITTILVMSLLFYQTYMFGQERAVMLVQRKEIEELNRSQNRFFSSMSHEIRTPINTIIGLNEISLRDNTLSEEAVTNARNIQGASRMLLALINDILDMSKMESGKMEVVPVEYDVATLLSEVVNMIWGRATEKGLEFHIDVDEMLPTKLYGDEVRIKQVLVNLLNNAVKYTQKGSIRLSVQSDKLSDREVQVTFRVEDTGMGIKREAIPYLFDAFKRVDEAENRNIEGTGLGLSIVKQIVDLMDGKISVDSIYTQGSTFIVSINQEIVDETGIGTLRLKSHRAARERETYRQSFEAPTAHLLIVDDNEMNLRVEAGLLRDTKIQIDLARSGAECLAMAFRKQYDVIFMDHLMPEMDGITCLKELRSQRGGLNRETPVIALTANAGSENQALYARNGFDGYLLKPVNGRQLEATLLKALPESKVNLTGATTIQSERETVAGQRRKLRKIVVTCESGIDLPQDLIKRYHIGIINLLVRTQEGLFRDNIDVDSDALMEYLAHGRRRASSDVPSVAEYERFFASALTKAQHIVHISLANRMSKACAHAMEAAASFDNVTVIDSETVSSGAGLLVLYAAYHAERAEDVAAFIEQVESYRKQIRMSFVLDSTDELAATGRLSDVAHTLAKSFMIHPLVRMRRGGMSVGRIFSGETQYYRTRYINYALRDKRAIDRSLVFITYVSLTEEELRTIRKTVAETMPFHRIILQKASSAMAVNGGKGSFGLMFCTKSTVVEEGAFDFLPRDLGAEEAQAQERRRTETQQEEIAESTLRLQSVYDRASGLDYREALRYLPDEEEMYKTLRTFYDNIEHNADEMERMLAEGDYENFMIRMHALRNTARQIGASELSRAAARLEEYGDIIGT